METNIVYLFFCYAAKFKSYYVVWKLGLVKMILDNDRGLNRTM